jgi:rhamnulokinase
VTAHRRAQLGVGQDASVIRVAEHDTASAVLALPVDDAQQNFAFISCGSWALVGQELANPVLTEGARLAGFTNEKGAFGSTLFMRNLAGLWLLEECVREWNGSRTEPLSAVAVVAEATAVQPLRSVFDVAHPDFLRPGDITGRIAAHCRRSGQAVPETPAQFARCILESLAIAYRLTIDHCEKLSGQAVDVVHITGGGSRNQLLCQFTADACDRSVMAGPAEATSVGNILVQMMAAGTIADKAHARAVVRASTPAHSYSPQTGSEIAWQAATRRVEDLSRDREEIVA